MGSFNNWDDDQDLYDWGSQFGKSSGVTKPSEQPPKKEIPSEAPAPAEPPTPVETPATTETPEEVNTPPETAPTPPEAPKPERKTMTREALEKMANQQGECHKIVRTWLDRFQQMLSLCEEKQLPKGIRAILNQWGHVSDTAQSTKALVDYLLETNEEQKYCTLEESKLRQHASSTYKMVLSYQADLEAALDQFEERIKQHEDRHILNLSTQAIKKVTTLLESHAKQQAKACSEALDAYSPAQGALIMMARFANRGDCEVMNSIDNTLNLAGTDFVLTEDAPAMLEALAHNDTDAIVRLQQKLIDHLFDKK